jgi:signal transduction histidine kinase
MARQRQLEGEASTHQMEVITRQGQQMVRLVDDLLDMARAENRKLELRKRLIDIRAVVRETVDAKRPLVESHRHRLALEVGAEPLLVDADPVRVAQVVANLVDNAAKYTPDGGTVTVAVNRTAAEVEISVTDTGEGLPPEQLTNIFHPFIQLNQCNRRNGGGLGLGLPLVQTLAELHGGSVRASIAGVGQGSCFTVSLPAVPRAKASGAAP